MEMIPPTARRSALFTTTNHEGGKKRTVTEPDLPSGSYTPTAMATQIHGKPTHNDRHGAVAAARHQEQSAVLDVALVFTVHVQQDTKPGHGDHHRDEREGKAVLQFVRAYGHHHGEAPGGCPRGNRVQLRHDGWSWSV